MAEDVITTGGSAKEVMEQIRAIGAEIVGVATIVDRSAGKANMGCRTESCVQLEIPVYDTDSCSLCEKGIPAVTPGSRKAD